MIPKFKIWDKNNSKMYTVMELDGIDYELSQVYIYDSVKKERIVISFDDCEFLQSTGLTDKNDVEIHNGDVLRNGNGNIGQVVFDEGAYYVVHEDYTKNCFLFIATNFDPEIEIIGNIYEQPHLLEEEK